MSAVRPLRKATYSAHQEGEMPAKTRKMTNIKVMETSGVDHPAHLHEGFAVMKAASPTNAKAIMEALGKERKMPPISKAAPSATPKMVTLSEADLQATIKKAVDAQLQTVLDEQAKAWQDLQAYANTQDDSVPSTATPAADTTAPAAAPAAVDPNALLKSLEGTGAPAAVLAIVKKQAEDINKARVDFEKERDTRLDQEAVTAFAKSYSGLAVSAEEVAPALRRLEPLAPEVHKSITGLLTSLQEQAKIGKASALLQEVGVSGVTKSAGYTDVEAQAQELLKSGQFPTIQKARAHVFETNPAAVTAVREEA